MEEKEAVTNVRRTRSGKVVRTPPAKSVAKPATRRTRKKVVLMEVEVSDDEEETLPEEKIDSENKEENSDQEDEKKMEDKLLETPDESNDESTEQKTEEVNDSKEETENSKEEKAAELNGSESSSEAVKEINDDAITFVLNDIEMFEVPDVQNDTTAKSDVKETEKKTESEVQIMEVEDVANDSLKEKKDEIAVEPKETTETSTKKRKTEDSPDESKTQETLKKTKMEDSIREGETKVSISKSETKDSIGESKTKDSIKESETKDSIKESETKDSIKESKAKDSIKESKAKDSIKESETKDSIKESRAKDSIKESETKDSIKESETKDSIKQSKAKDSIKESETKDSIKESETKDSIKESKAKDSIKESKAKDSIKESKAKDSIKESKAKDSIKESKAKDSIKESEAKDSIKESETKDSTKESKTKKSDKEGKTEEAVEEVGKIEFPEDAEELKKKNETKEKVEHEAVDVTEDNKETAEEMEVADVKGIVQEPESDEEKDASEKGESAKVPDKPAEEIIEIKEISDSDDDKDDKIKSKTQEKAAKEADSEKVKETKEEKEKEVKESEEIKEKEKVKKEDNKQNGDPDAENISEDELPGVPVVKVPEAEEVSDEELPGPKRAELPADTEVVSEDELPTVKSEAKKEGVKRKLDQGDYDPGSPTSENEAPTKKPSLETTPDKEKEEKPTKPKKLPELDKYWKAVNDDPTDFTGWTYLLQYVDQENDMEAAREAYDAFLSHYPYCYGYWRKYADYEKRKGNKKKCEEVFERGLKAIPLSVDLWIHYLTYVKTSRPDDEDYIRSQFERAIIACGLEFRSDRLWDSYIKWETEAKRLQKVTAIYDRLLATPTQGYTTHFDNFQEHISSNPPNKVVEVDEFLALRKEVRHMLKHDVTTESSADNADAPPGDEDQSKIISSDEETKSIRERIVSIRRKIHKSTVNAVTSRWNYEEGIKRPYFHVKPLERCQLKNWQDYLDYETEQGDRGRIIVLFERCLIACALYEEFWMKFVHYLEGLKDTELQAKIRDVYERACTIHHLKKPSLHLQWAMFEESVDNCNRAAEVLVNLEKSVPNVLQIAYRRINLERRRGDHEKCSQLYEHYISNSKNKMISSNIAIKYSRFCLRVAKNLEKAQEVLRTAISKDPNNPRLYLQLIDLTLQKENVTEAEITEVIDSFLEKETTDPEQKVLFAQRKLEYLEDFGTDIQSVQIAYDQYQKYIKQNKENAKKKEPKSSDTTSVNKKEKSATQSSSQSGSYGNYGNYGGTSSSQPSYPYSGSQQGQYNYSQYGQGDQYQYQNWQYPQGGYGGYNQWGGYSGGYGY